MSDAPGCNRYIGVGPIGGCSGTTVVSDISLSPAHDCLKIEANNCNGGMLEVNNSCGVPLVFSTVSIPPASGLDVVKASDGVWVPVDNDSNFTCEVVMRDTVVEIDGMLGTQPVTLTFTKTAPLCSRETSASHGRSGTASCLVTPQAAKSGR